MISKNVPAFFLFLCCGSDSDSRGYSLELSRALRTFDLPDCHAAELELCQQFDQPDQNKKWREGVIKSSFNYLLLDPRSDTDCTSLCLSLERQCFPRYLQFNSFGILFKYNNSDLIYVFQY